MLAHLRVVPLFVEFWLFSVVAWKASTSVGSSWAQRLVICIKTLGQRWPSVDPIKYVYYNVGPTMVHSCLVG